MSVKDQVEGYNFDKARLKVNRDTNMSSFIDSAIEALKTLAPIVVQAKEDGQSFRDYEDVLSTRHGAIVGRKPSGDLVVFDGDMSRFLIVSEDGATVKDNELLKATLWYADPKCVTQSIRFAFGQLERSVAAITKETDALHKAAQDLTEIRLKHALR